MAFLELHGIDKHFGSVHALREAQLEVERGEIHAVVGENGSGKTTLMRILTGDIAPERGVMTFDGQPASWTGPAAARAAGIGLVYQEPNLSPDLTVAENVFMGQLPSRWGRVDWRLMSRRFSELAADTGIGLSPRAYVRDLSPDRRQLVEIAKVVAAEPRLIALDEPTASLTEDQVDLLFALLRRFRDQGRAVIFITHRLREIFTLCDRATVLRDGETRSTLKVAEADEDEIIRLMVGRELGQVHRTPQEPGAPALEIRSLTRGKTLRNVSLHVRRGEIVGIAGLVGAGRSALFRTLVGLREPDTAEILVGRRPVRIRSPRDAIGVGMALVPEDRRQSGLCLDMSVTENIALVEYGHSALASVVNRSESRRRRAKTHPWTLLFEHLAARARCGRSRAATSRRSC